MTALPSWQKRRFNLRQLAFISRSQKEACKVQYTIDLESGTIKNSNQFKIIEQNLIAFLKTEKAIISFSEQGIRSITLEIIQATCNNILGQEYQFHILGSTRLGTHTLTSDLDILAVIPKELGSLFFLQTVQTQLEKWCESTRLIQDAQVPILKLQMDEIHVDLLCVKCPTSFVSMDALSEKHRRYLKDKKLMLGSL